MGDRFEKLPRVNTTYEGAHEVVKGDPRVDGPYLDEVRAREADDIRRWRNEAKRNVKLEENDTAAEQTAADVKAKAEVASQNVKKKSAAKKSAPAKKAAAGKK